MAEVINTNVFDTTKKFVDFAGLDYFWDKAKAYVDAEDAKLAARIKANEDAISSINDELNSLSGGAGSIATQIDNKIAALDLPNTYEAKGSAATALADAKTYADEEIAKLADEYDALGSAAAVAGDLDTHVDDTTVHITADERASWNTAKNQITAFLKDADMTEKAVDTLAELQTYMETDGAAATELVGRVAALEAIDHDTYKAADEALAAAMKAANDLAYDAKGAADAAKTAANSYTDQKITDLGMADYAKTADVNTAIAGVEAAYKAADTALETSLKAYADQAEADAVTTANAYADSLAGNYDAKGSAAQALADAKADADAKLANYTKTTEMTAAIEAAKNAAIADADTKLADYYNKKTIDTKLSENSAADQAYAKAYTDALFDSFQFAGTTDIDAIFA